MRILLFAILFFHSAFASSTSTTNPNLPNRHFASFLDGSCTAIQSVDASASKTLPQHVDSTNVQIQVAANIVVYILRNATFNTACTTSGNQTTCGFTSVGTSYTSDAIFNNAIVPVFNQYAASGDASQYLASNGNSASFNTTTAQAPDTSSYDGAFADVHSQFVSNFSTNQIANSATLTASSSSSDIRNFATAVASTMAKAMRGEMYFVSTKSYSSQSPHPFTGRLAECVTETMSNIFISEDPVTGLTIFQNIQGACQNFIVMAMILYIMFYGIKILMGGGEKMSDIFIFLLKFMIVWYFAVGTAWKDFFYLGIRSAASSIGTAILDSVNGMSHNYDGCVYPTSLYPPGRGYISFFDALDCKTANYIGMFPGYAYPVLMAIGFAYSFIPFAGQYIWMACVAIFLGVIVLVGRIVQMYLSAIIMLCVVVFLSTLAIPCVLFDKTKGFFDTWLKEVISLSIHPIIAVTFGAIVLTITDSIFYGVDPAMVFLQNNTSTSFVNSAGNTLGNPYGSAATPNSGCMSPGNIAKFNGLPPLVCILAGFAGDSTIGLPFPGFIEIIILHIPSNFTAAMLSLAYMLVAPIYIGLFLYAATKIIGQIEDVMQSLSGSSTAKMAGGVLGMKADESMASSATKGRGGAKGGEGAAAGAKGGEGAAAGAKGGEGAAAGAKGGEGAAAGAKGGEE